MTQHGQVLASEEQEYDDDNDGWLQTVQEAHITNKNISQAHRSCRNNCTAFFI